MPITPSVTSDTRTDEREERKVAPARRPRRVRHAARGEQRLLLAAHLVVDDERHHGRQEQDEPHHRAHLEVLLADHLLVHVDRQHLEAAADDLGHAELGQRHGEHDHRRGDEAVLGARAASR